MSKTMRETAVNIFAYGDGKSVHSLGYCRYMLDGTYEEITANLQARVARDHLIADPIELGIPPTLVEFNSLTRLGFIRYLLTQKGIIPEGATFVLTHIINGTPVVHEISDDLADDPVPDYLGVYWTDRGLDLTQLITDDYLSAVDLLWDNGKYISALKLLLSMIDTLGFVEYGPIDNCFLAWLDEYCDMGQAGVTSLELWELRNSLLHMTNLDSKKVRRGSVERLKPVIINSQVEVPSHSGGYKNFHLTRFTATVLPQGIDKWIRSYNEQPAKLLQFIHRYDTIVSEARLSVIPYQHA